MRFSIHISSKFKFDTKVFELNYISASVVQTNSMLATKIQDELERANRGFYWAVMVNSNPNSGEDFWSFAPVENFWNKGTTEPIINFAGKNVAIYGVDPPKDGESRECKPGYDPEGFFSNLVSDVLGSSNFSPVNVTERLMYTGAPSFDLEGLLAIAVNDADAGLEVFMKDDCTFEYKNDPTWKIMMYYVLESKPEPEPGTTTSQSSTSDQVHLF